MIDKSAWFFYLLGAFMELAWKLIRDVRTDKKQGIRTRDAILEWFFQDTVGNQVSWCISIGLVWVCGSIYIMRITWFPWLSAIPLHDSIAFFLGGLLEMVAPTGARKISEWVVSKMPGGGG